MTMSSLRSKIPGWSSLRVLGNNRLLRTAYFWLAFVPIVAKVLSQVEEAAHVNFFGKQLHLTLSLPFSWAIFFYGSLFTAIGNVIYALRCPEFAKRYDSYIQFEDQGKGPVQLAREFAEILSRTYKNLKADHLRKNIEYYVKTFCLLPSSPTDAQRIDRVIEGIDDKPFNAVKLASQLQINPELAEDAFWYLRNFSDHLYPDFRAACAAAYAAGIGCFGLILVQNIAFVVWRQLFKS